MRASELEPMAERERGVQSTFWARIFCCGSTSCLAAGAKETQAALQQSVAAAGLGQAVQVVRTGCMGLCSHGPLVRTEREGAPPLIYGQVTAETAREVVDDYLGHGSPAATHVLPPEMPFFSRQTRVVLSDVGRVDPERIEDSIALGGYQALGKVVETMTPAEACAEITRSGLRGRGGAGFPTGRKWELLRTAPGAQKYIIANGDEGDPGAYMDRTLMEDDPHRVLEGLAIAGYATGANRAFLYVRGEYPIAIRRLERAIRQAERHKILGDSVLGTPFGFKIEVRIGAGAFVCGEETALIASIEGRRGTPHVRPPYPTERGLWGQPTAINNVETYGNIAPIMRRGADWFGSIGTATSKGTKVFALTGKLRHTGLIEVPMGITLREIVEEIGGGIPAGRAFKAAQTGGPSGGCLPAQHLDVPIDYESLRSLGAIMGSGGLIIMDDASCMPDVARFFMEFCADESCGKCVPCRVGTTQMHDLLKRITSGGAAPADLARLEWLCDLTRTASLCGLGQSAPNPVLSTLRFFRDEYESHVRDGVCPAGVCQLHPAAAPALASTGATGSRP